MFQVRDQKPACVCVYCGKPGHKPSEYELVSETSERRLILSKMKLCFRCTGPKHCVLTAAVIKRVPVVKEYIPPQFVKKRQMFY